MLRAKLEEESYLKLDVENKLKKEIEKDLETKIIEAEEDPFYEQLFMIEINDDVILINTKTVFSELFGRIKKILSEDSNVNYHVCQEDFSWIETHQKLNEFVYTQKIRDYEIWPVLYYLGCTSIYMDIEFPIMYYSREFDIFNDIYLKILDRWIKFEQPIGTKILNKKDFELLMKSINYLKHDKFLLYTYNDINWSTYRSLFLKFNKNEDLVCILSKRISPLILKDFEEFEKLILKTLNIKFHGLVSIKRKELKFFEKNIDKYPERNYKIYDDKSSMIKVSKKYYPEKKFIKSFFRKNFLVEMIPKL